MHELKEAYLFYPGRGMGKRGGFLAFLTDRVIIMDNISSEYSH